MTSASTRADRVHSDAICSTQRLEFTVVGAAANHAARIETLCKTLGVPVLVSAPFASAMRGYGWRSLGHHALKDFVELIEVFTLDPFLAGQDGVG